MLCAGFGVPFFASRSLQGSVIVVVQRHAAGPAIASHFKAARSMESPLNTQRYVNTELHSLLSGDVQSVRIDRLVW